ncbi:MAG: tetratricopeptide repeat protein [Gammaproteobacteria bacterium]|nr:MAG: tetratricopeptide repeat protein [Gammaproteobacteria bacterium]
MPVARWMACMTRGSRPVSRRWPRWCPGVTTNRNKVWRLSMRYIEMCLAGLLVLSLSACMGPPPRKTEIAEESAAWAKVRERFDAGVAALEAGDLDTAEKAMLDVAGANLRLTSPYINLGLIAERRGHLRQAAEWYQQATELNPRSAEAWNQLGLIARQQGKFREAREYYEKAVRLAPEKTAFTLNLAILCDLYLRDADCALEQYRNYQAASASPDKQVAIWIRDLERRVQ